MIPSAELVLSQQQMSQAMHGATSPQCWQRSMSETLRHTFSALHGYQWLKNIKAEPKLNFEPLLGRCLEQVLDNRIDQSKEQNDQPSLQRKPAPPATEANKAKTSHCQNRAIVSDKLERYSASTEHNAKPERLGHKSNSKAESHFNQVMYQQKTAKVTSLRDWMQKGKNAEQAVKLELSSPHTNQSKKRNKQDVKTDISGAPKALTVLASNSSTWQRQIGQNIQKIINHVLPQNTYSVNKQKRQIKQKSLFKNKLNALPMWQQKIAADDSRMQVSLDMLQYVFAKNEPFQQQSYNANQRATESVDQSAVSTKLFNQQGLPAVETERLNKKGFVDQNIKSKSQKNTEFPGAIDQPKQSIKPTSSLLTSEKQPSTKIVPQVEIAMPEFPPVNKMINEPLQASGKRSALKRESQLLTPHEHDLDDEKLAEALKRIIDQQARRHGINV